MSALGVTAPAERTVRAAAGVERRGLDGLRGPLAFVSGVAGAGYHDAVELIGSDGRPPRSGRVLALTGDTAVIEVFGATEGLQPRACSLRMGGSPLKLGVGPELLGRVFDGVGRPRDGLPPPVAEDLRDVEGAAINPSRRAYPRDFLQTGVSAIDAAMSVVLGQKIPIFTCSGLPHHTLARQLLRQARAPGVEQFAVVFAALGLSYGVAQAYADDFRRSGAFQRQVAFLNLADDPPAERLIAPRTALTAAEYLAFDRGMHVLVVLADITAYGEALREVALARGEAPSRKGYPGYLYSDLASLFERAGRIDRHEGSITQVPIVTMPSGDVTHPIPDLTGYVTEGQIVLDRALHRRGVYPPVDLLPSLSRLMDDGIGEGRTRKDHAAVAKQLYASCAQVQRARALEAILGAEDLAPLDRTYLQFGRAFEQRFLAQREDEERTIAETLDRAWDVLHELPETELRRIPASLLAAHPAKAKGAP